MGERGYVVGKNLIVERRNADGKLDRLPALAAELVRLQMDVICASGPAIQAARDATGTIPIIMTFGIDPVGEGFVASLAHPGGHTVRCEMWATVQNKPHSPRTKRGGGMVT